MKHICDDCGRNVPVSLIWSGYVKPLPDAAPDYNEWQEYWLCADCDEEQEPIHDLQIFPGVHRERQ